MEPFPAPSPTSPAAPSQGEARKLTSEATAAVLTESANPEGDFVFTAVPPGVYTVSAEHPGFKKFNKQHMDSPATTFPWVVFPSPSEKSPIRHRKGRRRTILQTAVQRTLRHHHQRGDQDLTVLNRDFTTFAELQPGVVITSTVSADFLRSNTFNVNGGRSTANNITVDGFPTNNTNQGNANITISLDDTQTVEVKLSNSPPNTAAITASPSWPSVRAEPNAIYRPLLLRPQRSLQRQ